MVVVGVMPNGEVLLSVEISTLVYVATVRHASPLFENHVEKPSFLGSSLLHVA